MAKKSSILVEADPGDLEDLPVNRVALDRAHMVRRIRRLRNSLGLTQESFAERYGIPLGAIRQYEIARTNVFGPGICWSGLRLNRLGSIVHRLQMNS
jgi:DNA-binding transcriptional regulator YiaG